MKGFQGALAAGGLSLSPAAPASAQLLGGRAVMAGYPASHSDIQFAGNAIYTTNRGCR